MNRPAPLRSLRIRLLLVSLLIQTLTSVALVGNGVAVVQGALVRHTEQRIEAANLAYGTAVAGPLAARDYPTLRDILGGWMDAGDLLYLAVTDPAGQVLAAAGWPKDRPLPEPTGVGAGEGSVHVVFPVDVQGALYGRMHYGLSLSSLGEARAALFQRGTVVALLATAVSLLLLVLAGSWLTRDFVALAQASRRMAEGDLGVRVPVHGDDEVSELSRSFNAMAEAVHARVAELKEGERRFRAIADYTYAWESWLGPDGRLRWVNPAVERMTGYSVQECMHMADFPLPLIHPPDRDLVANQHRLALAGETGQDLEFRIDTRDRRTLWVAMAWQPIYASDDASSLGYRSSIRDITGQHYAREELAYAASHDSLTGLWNRRAFERELARELEERLPGQVILLYVDLDQFKVVNDTCGHTAGDTLLQHLARVMQGRFTFGFLARLGGDEFGMVLCDLALDEAERRAQHVIDDIRALPFVWEGRSFHVGASIGIAQSSMELKSVTDLLMAADTACYAAKDRGRNRAQVYLPADSYFVDRQLDFLSLSQISEALSAGRLELYAQRVVSLKPGLTDYAEVLVRMRGEGGELIPPSRFIPVAERYGLIQPIDRWVIQGAFRQLADWHREGRAPIKLNLNLSGLTLAEPGLTEFIAQTRAASGVDPAWVGFEITESCAIAQLDLALAFFEFCAECGFSLALDDFGSGLSSFGYLKRFKVQTIKIDGQFVRNADRDRDDRAVIESIVRLSLLRNLQTVGEFVSTPAVLAVVKALDVDFAQGFALHLPEPLARLATRAAGDPSGPGEQAHQPPPEALRHPG